MDQNIDQATFLDVPSLHSTVVIPHTATWDQTNVGTWRTWVQVMPWISGGDGTSEGDSGSGDGDGTDTDTSGGGGDDSGAGSGEKTLTQTEVNAIVSREVAKAQRGKLDPKELGFESGKELKEFLDKQKEAQDAAKDQATKDLEAAKEQATKDAEARVLSKANERLIRAEFTVQAKEAGVTSPADAYVLAKTMEIWTQVELVEDNDDVTVKGLDEDFFKELKEAKPFLFEQNGQGGGTDLGAGAGGGGRETDRLSAAELAKVYPALGNRT